MTVRDDIPDRRVSDDLLAALILLTAVGGAIAAMCAVVVMVKT